MAAWCEFIERIYWEYMLTIVDSITIIAMIFALYKYVVAHIRRVSEERPSRGFFFLSLAYYLSIIVFFTNSIVRDQYHCDDYTIEHATYLVGLYVYAVQMMLLLFIFLFRLVCIFEDTAYALPKWTTRLSAIFILFVTCLCAISISYAVFTTQWPPFWITLWVICGVIAIGMVIALNVAFIRKLIVVHQSSKDAASNQHGLLHVITKTAILCFVSTLLTFVCLIFFFVRDPADSFHFDFISDLILVFDLFTNYLCVLLAAKSFERWYSALCRGCHERLIWWCKLYNQGNGAMAKNGIEIQAVSPHSGCDST